MTTEAASASAAMHIGEVAARTELSLRTLRHYDEIGLLRPSGRTDGGFRLYAESDVEKIMLIRRMKPLGFTLVQVGEVLRDIDILRTATEADERESARVRLGTIQDEVSERRVKLERQLAMADEFVDLLGQELG